MLFVIISIFIALYAGLHYYVYKKIIIIVPSGHWLIITILGFLIFTPLLVALLADAGHTAIATPLAWVGYTWMGFVFLFFSFSVVLDLYRLLTKAGGRLLGVEASALIATFTLLFSLCGDCPDVDGDRLWFFRRKAD
ncbi:MAG: hypothetical protein JRF20_01215 [Deltaproteobacteria bacterium]|nr:hypothetical protein [Deltaproteobacteria bacterium]MBW2079969.1 hypothetical protein [Deltaproteobacteria bacterium]MBW2349802.1 hypothetical protein [Deltaproteobacteria bacterium]